ncbi:MAG: HAD family hydrolase [Sulfolobaceae archaeon]
MADAKFIVWLDGIILKIDLTEYLYKLYKGEEVEIPENYEKFEDWDYFSSVVGDKNIAILSPYDDKITYKIANKLNLLKFLIIPRKTKTKPSKEPYVELFKIVDWNPLNTITIASSPLDLLSSRFFDSRIKVICIHRFQDCSKYSPYLYVKKLIISLKRLRIL